MVEFGVLRLNVASEKVMEEVEVLNRDHRPREEVENRKVKLMPLPLLLLPRLIICY